jgi:hypothetical protein
MEFRVLTCCSADRPGRPSGSGKPSADVFLTHHTLRLPCLPLNAFQPGVQIIAFGEIKVVADCAPSLLQHLTDRPALLCGITPKRLPRVDLIAFAELRRRKEEHARLPPLDPPLELGHIREQVSPLSDRIVEGPPPRDDRNLEVSQHP